MLIQADGLEGKAGKSYEVLLVDNGTLDTVLSVNGYHVPFSQEYADQYMGENGELTPKGFIDLALQAIDDFEDSERLLEV